MKCFADKEPKKCAILINKESEGCKFFKTNKQYKTDRLKYYEKECDFRELTATDAERLYNQLTKE